MSGTIEKTKTDTRSDYTELMERAKEFKQQKEQVQSERQQPSEESEGVSRRTCLTKLTKGTIIDATYEEYSYGNSKLLLEVRLRSGHHVTVKITDTGEYTEENEYAGFIGLRVGYPDLRVEEEADKRLHATIARPYKNT